MFGFLRSKLTSFPPFQFHDDVVINRPAEAVFTLLDWGSPDNALRQRGSHVTPVDGAADQFTMTMDELPGHRFDIFVTDVERGSVYGFGIILSPILGRMAKSHELYSIEPLGPQSCRLGLVSTMLFVPMRPDDMPSEELKVSAANHNALVKLKLQAEQGVAAVQAVAGKLIV